METEHLEFRGPILVLPNEKLMKMVAIDSADVEKP